MFERSPEFAYDRRLDMMREATTRIDVMGVANLGLASHSQTLDLVRACAGRGVEIRILQCAPTNPALGSLVGARNAEHLDAIKSQINAATDAWKQLAEMAGGQLSLTVRPRADIAAAGKRADHRSGDPGHALSEQPHDGGEPNALRERGR